jgi:capsular polysaccharide export protein
MSPTMVSSGTAVGSRSTLLGVKTKPLANRRFLLVTLPSGPFGKKLGRQLERAGADVLRVILNGGDLISWGTKDALWPRVPRPLWQSWLEWQFFEQSITDVVVFGDSMIYSAEALAAARANGLRTWVLENGYNRPDWITIEPTGVNANSCLPRDPRFYREVELAEPDLEAEHIGPITPYHTLNITSYFTGVVLGWQLFPTYRYPYAVPLWPQIFGHIYRYCRGLGRQRRLDDAADAIMDGGKPYFLACLQREGDSQLLDHSRLKTNTTFMKHVIASFAAHAPSGHRLIFKNHPLDPGVEDLKNRCFTIARKHRMSSRVTFLDGGAFAHLARASKGVVAVNSTAAYAALGFGTPVKLLGRALFDIEGLTNSVSLDQFWTSPAPPDHELFLRFRSYLSERTQVYGSFHNPKHLDGTARRLVDRIISLGNQAASPPAGPSDLAQQAIAWSGNVTSIDRGRRPQTNS